MNARLQKLNEKMKVKSLTIQNYKKFTLPKTFSFCDEDGSINEITLILGNNGTGKSSILQAITMLLASAIRDRFSPVDLEWPGYSYGSINTGLLPPKVELQIFFGEEELETTVKFAKDLQDKGVKLGIPTKEQMVMLSLDYFKLDVPVF